MRAFPAIVANLVLVISALGLGNALRRWLPANVATVDLLAFRLLGGLGFLGTILFCVGQAWFSRTAIILILIFGVLLNLPTLATDTRALRAWLAGIAFPALPVTVIVAALMVTAIAGLAEPVGDMNNDSIAYHFLGPKVWLRDALIRPLPDEILTAFPSAVESLYAALMSLGGQRAPGFFAVTSLLALLLIAASLALRLGLRGSGVWWTAALIITMPAVHRGAARGYIDVLFAAFVLAAVRIAFDAGNSRQYALFGVFFGFALGTKYTALVTWVLLVLCSLVISVWAGGKDYRAVVKGLALSCIVAIVLASPSYLRNWIVFDSPIYPAPLGLLHFFGATQFQPEVIQELQRANVHTGTGMGHTFWKFFLLPFNLTYHTANFRGSGGIGLTPLALAPFGLLAYRRDRFAKGLFLLALLQVTVWFFTAQESRYLIYGYVFAALFAVLGWQYVQRLGAKYGSLLAALVVACSMLYGLEMIISVRASDLHAGLSRSFEAKTRLAETPFIESFDYLNADSSVRKVLILDPHVAAFFSDKPYLKPVGRWGEQTLPDATDVPKILSELFTLQISHILDVRREGGAFRVPEDSSGLTLVFQRDDQRIYRVDKTAPSIDR